MYKRDYFVKSKIGSLHGIYFCRKPVVHYVTQALKFIKLETNDHRSVQLFLNKIEKLK